MSRISALGRHGDGGGLYLVVGPSGARRWIVRVVVKGPRNKNGAPLRTDFGLGGADLVTLNQARERALEYRRMARQGLHPRYSVKTVVPTFAEVVEQVHIDRLPTWKNAKHGQQWINTLREYAFSKIGRMPVDSVGQPEVMMCLAPIWTEKHETAKRLAQRIKTVLDVARSKGMREGANSGCIVDRGVLEPADLFAAFSSEGQKLNVHLDMMSRHLLLIAIGVQLAHACASGQSVEAVTL